MQPLSPIHTADADETKLFCRVASASAVCTWIRDDCRRIRTHNTAVGGQFTVLVTTADGCVHTDDTTKLSPTSCEFVYTPPTRRDSTISSRRRCVLGFRFSSADVVCIISAHIIIIIITLSLLLLLTIWVYLKPSANQKRVNPPSEPLSQNPLGRCVMTTLCPCPAASWAMLGAQPGGGGCNAKHTVYNYFYILPVFFCPRKLKLKLRQWK